MPESLLNRRIDREIKARKAAERILEEKALEVHYKNLELQRLNQELENKVLDRTKQLEESKKAYKGLVEKAGDIIFNLDSEGRFIYVNPVTERVLGLRIDEILGKHFSEFVHTDHQKFVVDFYLNNIEGKQKTSYLEFPVVSKGGKSIWLGQKADLTFNNDGTLEKVTAVARDITEKREAQERIRKSEEKYRGLIENMELGLMEIDSNGKVARAYDWFCDMTGYSESELLGKDPLEVLVREEDIPVMQMQEANRKSRQAGIYEIEIRKKDGNWIWVLISGAPILNESGDVVGSMGIHYDITERKNLERDLRQARDEAERARLAEKEFLAQMSHEIRTPLNAVIGMANLLITTELNEYQSGYVQDIKYAADVLHGLISDVLDLSKIEAGQLELSESLVNVHQSVAMLSRTLEYRAKEKGNKLTFKVDPDVPQLLLADRNIINQVLINLVGNSIKFTKDKSIHIDLKAEISDDNICNLLFSVKDEGIGIAEDKLETVFEKFKQAEGRKTHKEYGGTGLGLPICKHLIELHGGNIWIESELGKGTQFFFNIRTMIPEGSAKGEVLLPEINENEIIDISQLHFLVVEDTFLNQKYIQGLLKRWNAKWVLAENGKIGVEKSKEQTFDLILMDMQMPEMDGYQATRAIRGDDNNPNQNVPIVALTASALIDEKNKALSAGMNDHLSKPFTPDQLETVVQRWASNSASGKVVLKDIKLFESIEVPESLDQEFLIDFYDGDLDYAHHMATVFRDSLSDEISQAIVFLKEKRSEEWIRWLHSLSPMLSMVGATSLSSEFKRLELDCKKESNQNIWERNDFDALLLELNKTGKAVQQWIDNIEKVIS